MSTTTSQASDNEATILARVLSGENGRMSSELARYVLDLSFSDRDKARMHDLLERNQEDALSPAERDEMHAFGRAGDLLGILKSKARRSLGIKLKHPATF